MTDINWDLVKAELDELPFMEEDYNPGVFSRRTYIGSIFALTPSGKYYVPFACSNVEACQACRDSFEPPCSDESPCAGTTNHGGTIKEGEHCEVCRDARWNNELNAEATERGYSVENGEGDPCDLFIVEYKDDQPEPEPSERLRFPRFTGEGDSRQDWSSDVDRHVEGQLYRSEYAAPGTGYCEWRCTRVDAAGVWGVTVNDTGRELKPWEVV